MRRVFIFSLLFSVGCLDFLKEDVEETEEEDSERKEGTREGDCLDGEDNDDDGDIDCDDSGCDGKPACLDDTAVVDTGEDTDTDDPLFEDPENGDCADGLDNDGDGEIDCEDSDCLSAWECDPAHIDSDQDGFPDVEDCEPNDPAINPGMTEVPNNNLDDDCDGYIDETLIESGADCSDEMDNDLDGVSDCDDSDCVGDPSCVSAETVCEDTCVDTFGFGLGIVNNGQCEDGGLGDSLSGALGLPWALCDLGTDCSDCGNRIDADGDGHEDNPAGGSFMWDCDDSNANVNSSASEVANNGLDDDCDGTVDNAGSSSETDCSNGVDDDSDGDIDCDDSDCANDSACQVTAEVDCTDGIDNDSDGDIDCDDSDCINDSSCATSCLTGEILDCNGNCAPANWLGDGYCDNGAYDHNGIAIYLNCAQYSNDNGDCP